VLFRSKTSFNVEMGIYGVWTVGDATTNADEKTRNYLAATLKEHAANVNMRMEAKYSGAVTIPGASRVVLTCNIDEGSVSVIPEMGLSNEDKLMLFMVNPDWKPTFNDTLGDNKAMLMRELPYFLRWLINWEPPASIIPEAGSRRFGIKPYHHPRLVEESKQLDISTAVVGEMDDCRHSAMSLFRIDLDAKGGVWQGTSGDIAQAISEFRGHGGVKYHPNTVGKSLSKVIRRGEVPWIRKKSLPGDRKGYEIDVPALV